MLSSTRLALLGGSVIAGAIALAISIQHPPREPMEMKVPKTKKFPIGVGGRYQTIPDGFQTQVLAVSRWSVSLGDVSDMAREAELDGRPAMVHFAPTRIRHGRWVIEWILIAVPTTLAILASLIVRRRRRRLRRQPARCKTRPPGVTFHCAMCHEPVTANARPGERVRCPHCGWVVPISEQPTEIRTEWSPRTEREEKLPQELVPAALTCAALALGCLPLVQGLSGILARFDLSLDPVIGPSLGLVGIIFGLSAGTLGAAALLRRARSPTRALGTAWALGSTCIGGFSATLLLLFVLWPGADQLLLLARRTTSATNLRCIRRACAVYTASHDESVPPSLETLVTEDLLDKHRLISPLDDQGECSYVYCPTRGSGRPTFAFLVYEKPENYRNRGALVLTAGETIEWVPMPDFRYRKRWQEYITTACVAFEELDYDEMERNLKLSLKEAEALGPQDWRLVGNLELLACFYSENQSYAKARAIDERVAAIWDSPTPPEWEEVAYGLQELSRCFRTHYRESLAKRLQSCAGDLRRKYGPGNDD